MLSPPVILVVSACLIQDSFIWCVLIWITSSYCSIQAFLNEHLYFLHDLCACMCFMNCVLLYCCYSVCSEDFWFLFWSFISSQCRRFWTYINLCQIHLCACWVCAREIVRAWQRACMRVCVCERDCVCAFSSCVPFHKNCKGEMSVCLEIKMFLICCHNMTEIYISAVTSGLFANNCNWWFIKM